MASQHQNHHQLLRRKHGMQRAWLMIIVTILIYNGWFFNFNWFANQNLNLVKPGLAQQSVYYLAPDGSDTNSGTSSQNPWGTFDYAIPQLQPGDTLILLNGTYTQGITGLLHINCNANAQNGTVNQPITIQAQNERQAFIKGDGSISTLTLRNCAYWRIEGIRAESADNPNVNESNPQVFHIGSSNNCTLRRCLGAYNNRYQNSKIFSIGESSNILIEESEAYYFHRHGIGVYRSDQVTIRRCYVNSRGYADITGGLPSHAGAENRGDEGITLYQSTNSIVENSISQGDEFFGNSGQNNSYLGSISITNLWGFAVGHHATESYMEARDSSYINNVSINATKHGFALQSDINTLLENNTFINNGMMGFYANNKYSSNHNPQLTWQVIPSFTSRNNLAVNNTNDGFYVNHALDFSSRIIEYSNAYNNNPNWGSGTETRTHSGQTDPQLGSCLVFIPDNSPMKETGRNGADIGANILYRYQDGILTNQPLWNPTTGAFPCGAIVVGLNDAIGQSCFDVHQRLNINVNGCSLPPDYGQSDTPYISLTKSTNMSQVQPGEIIIYTIVYHNTSLSPAQNVIIKDNLPINTAYLSSNPPAQLIDRQLIWNLGSLNSGQQGDLEFKVKVK